MKHTSNELFNTASSVIDDIQFNYNGNNYHFAIKRDDLIDDLVSGNKWRKLKFNISQAFHQQKNGVITFGGAYSNHLIAAAKACHLAGLKSIGIVRGDELNEKSNSTLTSCHSLGMQLVFVSREEYKQRYDYAYTKSLQIKYADYYLIPEGGANFYGIVGCLEIPNELTNIYNHVFTSMGTGTTAAGLRMGLPISTRLHVVSALKGNNDSESVKHLITQMTHDESTTQELLDHTTFYEDAFGGYGKWNDELVNLVRTFFKQTGIKTDLVYTAKVIRKITELIDSEKITKNEKVLMIHTGGVQGMKKDLFEFII